LIGSRNELYLGRQFPFAQTVEVNLLLRDTQRVRKHVWNNAAGPGHIERSRAGIEIPRWHE
jgi:hypothetical protein